MVSGTIPSTAFLQLGKLSLSLQSAAA
jgi:hypothetical protein